MDTCLFTEVSDNLVYEDPFVKYVFVAYLKCFISLHPLRVFIIFRVETAAIRLSTAIISTN